MRLDLSEEKKDTIMAHAKTYQIKALSNGETVHEVEGQGRVNKLAAFRRVMEACPGDVEIWMTEIGAKAWVVYGKAAGANEANRLRSEPK